MQCETGVCDKGMHPFVGTQRRGRLLPWGTGRVGEATKGGVVWAKPELTVCGLLGAAPDGMSWVAEQVAYLEPSQF